MAFRFDWNITADDDGVADNGALESGSNGTMTPLDGLETEISDLQIGTKEPPEHTSTFTELDMDTLLDHLPPAISFSELDIPLTIQGEPTGETITVLRRDLFDARFQLANEEDDSDDEGSSFGNMIPRNKSPPQGIGFSASTSDLIKGVYEGGMKTWEASLDLVDCLHEQGYGPGHKDIHGKTVLEIGCGSAIPTVYLLEALFHKLLASPSAETATENVETLVHFQDYNAEVLIYITFVNVLLAYWKAKRMAERAESANDSPSPPPKPTESLAEIPPLPASQPSPRTRRAPSGDVTYSMDADAEAEVNELPLTTEFVDSFFNFLKLHKISLKFSAGSWQTFPPPSQQYDIVLTSETVYETTSLPPLCRILQEAATAQSSANRSSIQGAQQMTLVACKRVYFGVGGGEFAFRALAEKMGATVENVWHGGKGVDRTVMQVRYR